MTLNFTNPSRCFDPEGNRICFWGYDKTMEISFFLGVDALRRMNRDVGFGEEELLSAFDATVERTHEVAAKIYSKRGSGQGRFMVTLTADDF